MVPAQELIDKESESKRQTAVKGASNKVNGSFYANPDEGGMMCASNCEDTAFYVETYLDEQTKVPEETEDAEVDVVECVNTNDTGLAEAEDPNATEYSSSFGDTFSGIEDESRLSDAEVQSKVGFDNGSMRHFQMRKKKLTTHWRRFIRPIMWRCKWIELQIKKFQSQVLKYDRELAECEWRRKSEMGQFTLGAFGTKSLPFSDQSQRRKAMKRRKRKRVEATIHIPSYMANHCLFSYYENKKRPDLDDAPVDDDCGKQGIAADQIINRNDEFGVDDEWSLLEFREGNSFEQILWRIETMQSRVDKLKSQLDNAMFKYSGRFSSVENLSLPVPLDTLTASAQSPTSSSGNRHTIPVGALYTPHGHMSEYDVKDTVMPESAVSSNEEANPLLNIVETTMGLLSAAHASLDQYENAGSYGDIVDDVLIHNQEIEEEFRRSQEVSTQLVETPRVPAKGAKEVTVSPLVPAPEPKHVLKEVLPTEQSALESCFPSKVKVPKNKRKRGKRTGSSNWKRRSMSELEAEIHE